MVYPAGLVDLNPLNSVFAFLLGEELGRRRAIGEEEGQEDRPRDGDNCVNEEEPLGECELEKRWLEENDLSRESSTFHVSRALFM